MSRALTELKATWASISSELNNMLVEHMGPNLSKANLWDFLLQLMG